MLDSMFFCSCPPAAPKRKKYRASSKSELLKTTRENENYGGHSLFGRVFEWTMLWQWSSIQHGEANARALTFCLPLTLIFFEKWSSSVRSDEYVSWKHPLVTQHTWLNNCSIRILFLWKYVNYISSIALDERIVEMVLQTFQSNLHFTSIEIENGRYVRWWWCEDWIVLTILRLPYSLDFNRHWIGTVHSMMVLRRLNSSKKTLTLIFSRLQLRSKMDFTLDDGDAESK